MGKQKYFHGMHGEFSSSSFSNNETFFFYWKKKEKKSHLNFLHFDIRSNFRFCRIFFARCRKQRESFKKWKTSKMFNGRLRHNELCCIFFFDKQRSLHDRTSHFSSLPLYCSVSLLMHLSLNIYFTTIKYINVCVFKDQQMWDGKSIEINSVLLCSLSFRFLCAGKFFVVCSEQKEVNTLFYSRLIFSVFFSFFKWER